MTENDLSSASSISFVLSASTLAGLQHAGLDTESICSFARSVLDEDLSWGPDVTTASVLNEAASCHGAFISREAGVAAGIPVAGAVMEIGCSGRAQVFYLCQDGDRIEAGTPLIEVKGSALDVLTAERSALNILTHLCGVATATRHWVDAVGGRSAVRDTRKTLPGLRVLQKYAVRCGGGVNHRMGLGDAALVKDNHVAAAGSIKAAVEAVKVGAKGLEIEVECDNLDQLREALDAGVELVLLDNMTTAEVTEAVEIAREHPNVRLEASGGLSIENAAAYAATGVDFLAVGALTHSVRTLDIGFDLYPTF